MAPISSCRAATLLDLDAIMAIQRDSYEPGLVEGAGVVASIIACGQSLVCVMHPSEEIVGYLLAHPAPRDRVPLLHAPVEVADALGAARCMFIHDLSVHQRWRGLGFAASLVTTFLRASPDATQLVAVNRTEAFWARFGFAACSRVKVTPEILSNYGGACAIMERPRQGAGGRGVAEAQS